MNFAKPFGLLAGLLLVACVQLAVDPAALVPPVAPMHAYEVKSPHGTRIDNYYWLRDDTRTSREVLGYLEAENRYKDAWLAHNRGLQDKIFDEIVGRLKQDDASPPQLDRGYWYYTR